MKKITNALCPLFSDKKKQKKRPLLPFLTKDAKISPSFFEEGSRKIYFLGIGGVSMSALASLLLDKSFCVYGSDRVENSAILALKEKGASIEIGEKGEGLEGASLLVYTLAASESNPVLQRARKMKIPTISRPAFLGALALRYPASAAVSGMHGKSSTVGLCASILKEGLGGTVLSGAPLSRKEGCYRSGKDDLLLMEACEYKAAFLSFSPTHAAILNMEWEHTDYYKNEKAVLRAFRRFARKKSIKILVLPKSLASLRPRRGVSVFTFGEGGDFSAEDREEINGCFSFSLCYRQRRVGKVRLQTPGAHQVENALAAAALSFSLGASFEALLSGLSSYLGIPRRMEKIGEIKGAPLYLDYAHHPSELSATLASAQGMGAPVLVFQPHTYSRLSSFHSQFVSLFKGVKAALLPVYAARESAPSGVNSERVAKDAGALFLPDFEAAARFLTENAREGNILLLVGAGDIEGVIPHLSMERNESN